VLPTLGFILCAYGIYALLRVWSRRHRRQVRYSSRWRQGGRLTLVGGTGVGLGIIILIAILGLPSQYENLTSASIISTSWGHHSLGSGQALPRQENLPIKSQGDPGKPVYAYLHPETPSAQLQPEERAPAPRPLHKPKFVKPRPQGKAPKAISQAPKKDKVPSQTRARIIKKPYFPARSLAANPD